MHMAIESPNSPTRKPSSWRWPAIIVGLLVGHVTLMMIAVVIISQRPGESAVIPDYYEKEISYDSYKAQVVASKNLGWSVTVQQTGEIDAMGLPKMSATVLDQAGKIISGADVTVHCFHWSHGDQAATLTAKPDAEGYGFVLPRKYQGFWEFDVTVKLKEETFIQSVTSFVN
jgi:hypothetical protein